MKGNMVNRQKYIELETEMIWEKDEETKTEKERINKTPHSAFVRCSKAERVEFRKLE